MNYIASSSKHDHIVWDRNNIAKIILRTVFQTILLSGCQSFPVIAGYPGGFKLEEFTIE